MASNNFTYSPTSGNGTTNVSVSVQGGNSTHADKNSTLTFTNGTGSKTVALKQKYIPYFNQQLALIPASGGSLTMTAYTEYDIAFRDVPSWITITRGGTTVPANQKISASVASGTTFTINASENTGDTRTGGSFKMSHYIGDTLQTSNYQLIDITQESGSTPTPSQDDVNVIVQFGNSTPRGNWTVIVGITSHNSTYNSRTFTLNTLKPQDEDYITVALNTGGTTNLDVEVMVNTSTSLPMTTDNICNYDGDTDTDQAVTLGDTSFFHYVYATGEDMTITVEVNI